MCLGGMRLRSPCQPLSLRLKAAEKGAVWGSQNNEEDHIMCKIKSIVEPCRNDFVSMLRGLQNSFNIHWVCIAFTKINHTHHHILIQPYPVKPNEAKRKYFNNVTSQRTEGKNNEQLNWIGGCFVCIDWSKSALCKATSQPTCADDILLSFGLFCL